MLLFTNNNCRSDHIFASANSFKTTTSKMIGNVLDFVIW